MTVVLGAAKVELDREQKRSQYARKEKEKKKQNRA
jgi:hypothetical protein